MIKTLLVISALFLSGCSVVTIEEGTEAYTKITLCQEEDLNIKISKRSALSDYVHEVKGITCFK